MNIITKKTKEIDIRGLIDEQTFASSAYFFLNLESTIAGSPATKPIVEPIARDSAPYKNGVEKIIAITPNASR
jgi:hypothetical protein